MDNDKAEIIAIIAAIVTAAALFGLAAAVFLHWLIP